MKKLNKKGVSLAELLAVVVIMGIIAAIAIPLVGNVIETSKKKAFLGDVTTIVEAARTYCVAEGKAAFCDEYTRDTENTKAENIADGSFAIVDGVLVDGTNGGSSVTINATLLGTELDKYVSKDIDAKIGTGINIIYDGSTYWIKVTTKYSGGKYITNGFIDVTNTDADLDSLVKE